VILQPQASASLPTERRFTAAGPRNSRRSLDHQRAPGANAELHRLLQDSCRCAALPGTPSTRLLAGAARPRPEYAHHAAAPLCISTRSNRCRRKMCAVSFGDLRRSEEDCCRRSLKTSARVTEECAKVPFTQAGTAPVSGFPLLPGNPRRVEVPWTGKTTRIRSLCTSTAFE